MRAGAVVAWWNGNEPAFAVLGGEEKQRLRLVDAKGREERVKPNRLIVEVEGPGKVPGKDLESRRRAGLRAEAAEVRARARAATIDVALLWEIVSEQGGEAELTSAELADLALDDDGGEASAALLLALVADGVHFARRAEGWQPRPASAVEDLRHERESRARRETEARELFESLRRAARGDAWQGSGSATERRYLDALEQLAVHAEAAAAPARELALEALEASGLRHDRPHEGAFRLLRCTGRFTHDDENLQVERYRLSKEFPPQVLQLAEEAAAAGFSREGREDLTALPSVSIDSPHTREIDDLLSLELLGDGNVRLGVHIADPAAFFAPGDPIDAEALSRGITHYMPDLRITMLPPAICERAASLLAGEERPALSFVVDLDEQGRLCGERVVRSVVRSDARLDYDGVDAVLATGEGPHVDMLSHFDRLAVARQLRRVEAGAVPLLAPEVDVRVDGDAPPVLERMPVDSAARRIVTEAMVLAGEVAARFCQQAGLPTVYRRQARPDELPEFPADGARDPVLVRSIRRRLRRAEATMQPAPHFALGLPAYVQATSPLRRFQDLALHRQIAAALAGEPPPYDDEALQRVAATTERAENDARRAERAANEFWLLRYLEAQTGSEVEALVVDDRPRPVIQLAETLWEQPMPSLAGTAPGERLTLKIERVNPRAGVVVLRRT